MRRKTVSARWKRKNGSSPFVLWYTSKEVNSHHALKEEEPHGRKGNFLYYNANLLSKW